MSLKTEAETRATAALMIKYFWEEKSDPTRWTGWEAHKHMFPKVCRELEAYLQAENNLTNAINAEQD